MSTSTPAVPTPPGLTVLCVGNGDAFSRSRYSTSLVLEAEGHRLLIDCPHPIRKMLAEADPRLDLGDLDGLLLTHLHGDHASGVEGWAFAHHFGLQRRGVLLAHPEVAEPLWPAHLQVTMRDLLGADGPRPPMTFADYFDWRPLGEAQPTRFGPFEIEVRRTYHHIPTFAFRVRAGGATVGYSADTGWDPALFEWLCAADAVVHETNLGPAHTPFATLCALPPAQRDKLRLVAWPDGLDVHAGPIPALAPGQRLAVTAAGWAPAA